MVRHNDIYLTKNHYHKKTNNILSAWLNVSNFVLFRTSRKIKKNHLLKKTI